MPEHYISEITQKALIAEGNRIILTRDINDPLWELPGGRLNVGEKPNEGLEREIFEEIGLKIKVIRPFSTDVATTAKGNTRFMVVYLCELTTDSEIRHQEDEIAEHKLVNKDSWNNLPIYPEFIPVLTEYFSDKGY
jgi:ADP-ribose pyrophosphatase YjhB (NUDIX family)